MAKLYLIPTTLGESATDHVIPTDVSSLVLKLNYFIVENIRTARRYLRKLDPQCNIDDLIFFELNQHTDSHIIQTYLDPIAKGFDVGIISEAGCPGVADPGAEVVKHAHLKNIDVVPLVGPSSILLSLMASGLNGQNFAFVGYIPVKTDERPKAIKELERKSVIENQTQIFIEAPYRNTPLIQDLLKTLGENTRLCIACDLTLETEFVKTKTVGQWRKSVPELNKRPTIFLLLSSK
ncbi:MAG: SAM-dependent methyltransferase [Bacteroidia bacterium]|nr:SAM-dependent methyltransferase [Bacteroidia bacterium]